MKLNYNFRTDLTQNPWNQDTQFAFCTADFKTEATPYDVALAAPSEWRNLYRQHKPVAFICGTFYFLKFNNVFSLGAEMGWRLLSQNGWHKEELQMTEMIPAPKGSNALMKILLETPDPNVFPGEKHLTLVVAAMMRICEREQKQYKTACGKMKNYALYDTTTPASGAPPIRRLSRRGKISPVQQ